MLTPCCFVIVSVPRSCWPDAYRSRAPSRPRHRCPPSGTGTSTFMVFAGGSQMGTERVVVTRTAEGWTILSTGRISAPVDITARRMEVRYTAGLEAAGVHDRRDRPEPAADHPHDLRRHDREERHHDRRRADEQVRPDRSRHDRPAERAVRARTKRWRRGSARPPPTRRFPCTSCRRRRCRSRSWTA